MRSSRGFKGAEMAGLRPFKPQSFVSFALGNVKGDVMQRDWAFFTARLIQFEKQFWKEQEFEEQCAELLRKCAAKKHLEEAAQEIFRRAA